MTSERIRRQIDRLLDEAADAISRDDWQTVRQRANAALAFDSENADARAYSDAADRAEGNSSQTPSSSEPASAEPPATKHSDPTSFSNGRYSVTRFLGEGGKKKVYLAHDAQLDRDVAFALIKTEGLDDAARQRITREAQAMGRLGSHPHIVTVYDIGEENGQPYLVLPVLPGGDVEGVIEDAPDHKLSIEQAVKIATETCLGLEFSHSKGIIHRDLKPGNVWLAEDGRAMIGDFGLAVAVDRSRLTQAGMMVGTVNYMPPEQAMGGEVAPRSDLYSLGAMLYEMVCGRPPFVGDESVAIIGQHLNTPPVAPTWHRPDCPVALEALILRLLEKDPEKRPATATEVREALAAVGPAKTDGPSVQQPVEPRGADPLYRRVFVGREAELRQLHQAYDAAVSGQGGLVMVVGEPGIGKTALCEQLATYAAMRGGRWLVGHCYEEGSLSLPYLAFVEALRSYVLERDPDSLRSELGSGAAEVARLVSEVRDKVPVDPPTTSDPEDDRWRLLTSITTFLRNAGNVQPIVMVLEDLHWADRGTLDLLLHVARSLDGARLLIVGTYRDVEVDRTHPLSATLADLRRINTFLRVPLRGLTVDEVHRMYEQIRGQGVGWDQAELVHRQTEGNPLFVQEVLRFLVEEGIVVRQDGRYVAQTPGEGVPEGLRDVIGRRLGHLSDLANQVLSTASVIGRDFRVDVLQLVAGQSEDEVLQALEEATDRSIIEQREAVGSLAFRFTHAFFRQVLYEEIFAARRIRWHQNVGRALETVHAHRLDEHAAELAEHFSNSTDVEDLEKAVRYGEMAAGRALRVYANGEAVRHLEQALRAQEVLDSEDKAKRCDLLLALGEAMLALDNPWEVIASAAEPAYSLAEALNDSDRAVGASLLALQAMSRGGFGTIRRDILNDYETWIVRTESHAPPDSVARVYADVNLAMLSRVNERFAEGGRQLERALDLSRRIEDNSAFFAAAGRSLMIMRAAGERATIEALASEVLIRPRDGVGTSYLVECFLEAGFILWESGDRTRAEAAWHELSVLAERTHDASLAWQALIPPAFLLFSDGRVEEALETAEQLEVERQEAGFGLGRFDFNLLLETRCALGRPLGESYQIPERGGRPSRSVRASLEARSGNLDAAKELAQGLVELDAPERMEHLSILYCVLDAAVRTGEKQMAEILTRELARFGDELASAPLGSVGRLLGSAAAMLGRPAEARSFYERALAVCEKVHFRPEVAMVRLSLAELLLDHYPDEHDAAIEHLDFAIAEFRDMKMQPALERALGSRGLLKA